MSCVLIITDSGFRRWGLRETKEGQTKTKVVVLIAALTVPLMVAVPMAAQQLATHPLVQANFTGMSQIGSNVGNVTQMKFGPDGRLYVATFTNGIKRFDYDPAGNLTDETTVWSRSGSCSTGSQCNGSLGIAFHEDATLGTVMYIAPAVSSSFNVTVNITQSIVRLTDNDGDGNWGEVSDSEVNQPIVDNLRMTDLHQVNQLLVDRDTLYVGIGSRTRTGGDVSEYDGPPNPDDGEFSYTGAINWIRDLTQLSGDATTPNIAGFNIAAHHTEVRPFTSNDTGKLTVYSTGFRNVFGLAMDAGGQLWATMNQNENPLKPDELHRSDFKDDHKFPKENEGSGDWKQNAAALAAGFFQTFEDPVATLGNHASADGLAFTYRNHEFAGHPFVVRFAAGNDLLALEPETGALVHVATGFNSPLDVLADPDGNLLVGAFGGGGQIFRLSLVEDAGDYNGDNIVNAADYVVWRKTLGETGSGMAADGNGDNIVNHADFDLWRSRFGSPAGSGAALGETAIVPEPRAIAMALSLVGLGAAFRSRRRALPSSGVPDGSPTHQTAHNIARRQIS